MQVIACDQSHAAGWNRWVNTSAQASFYHRFEWKSINETSFGHRTAYLAAEADGEIVGVLPIVRLKSRLFGNIACSMPFVNYGGPAGQNDEIEQQLIDGARPQLDDWNVDYFEMRSRRDLGDRFPASLHKVSMTVRLEPDPDVVWNRYKAKAGPRQEIRRGHDNGYVATFGRLDLLDPLYEVLSESWRNLGTPIFRKSYLHAVVSAFPDDTWVCVVRSKNGTAAAGALCGAHHGVAEGLWLGVSAAHRKALAGYVLYWELIKDACRRGLTTFHLGRSTKDGGGQAFKHKWQAELQQLYWHYLLRTRKDIPSLNVDSARYQLAIRAWRRLPVRVTQQLGPFLAGSIP